MSVAFEKTVCVYCGSSNGNGDVYTKAASELGELFHGKKWRVINGGGAGLMEAVSKTTYGEKKDGFVTGIIPKALLSPDHPYFQLPESKKDKELSVNESGSGKGIVRLDDKYGESVIVPDMHTRKLIMAEESDAFVALPGGFGTLEEILECITWSQLNIHQKPIVLFNVNGFYNEFVKFVDTSIASGFMNSKNRDIFKIAETPKEVIEYILSYEVPEGRFKFTWNESGNVEKKL